MPAVKAGRHHKPKAFMQGRVQLCQEGDGYQHAHRILQDGDAGDVEKHAHDFRSGHGALLGPVPDRRRGKDHDNQDACIGSKRS